MLGKAYLRCCRPFWGLFQNNTLAPNGMCIAGNSSPNLSCHGDSLPSSWGLHWSQLRGASWQGATSSAEALTGAGYFWHLPTSDEPHALQMTLMSRHIQLRSDVCIPSPWWLQSTQVSCQCTQLEHLLLTQWNDSNHPYCFVHLLFDLDRHTCIGCANLSTPMPATCSPLKPSSTFFLMITWSPMMWSPNTLVSILVWPPFLRACGAIILACWHVLHNGFFGKCVYWCWVLAASARRSSVLRLRIYSCWASSATSSSNWSSSSASSRLALGLDCEVGIANNFFRCLSFWNCSFE